MSPKIFFIEGNIGSGKSTFLKNLEKYNLLTNVQFIQEPVNEWKETKDKDGINILEHFYSDMNRHCYTFQSFAFISRINQLDQIDDTKSYVFIERSVFCDKNVFARSCYETKIMSDIEWKIYNKWFDWMVQKYKEIFDRSYIIYLSTSPETAIKRINKRGREEETTITLEYIDMLNKKHEEWLDEEKNVYNIDANQNICEEQNMIKLIEDLVK
jgi:deoxyadenosine/deoxycytidine kinase